MAGLNVLIVGSGGREHAIARKMSESSLCGKLFAAPGNPGIAEIGECFNVKADDVDGIVDLVKRLRVDFTVVGPEVPLALGLVDRLEGTGKKAFGPVQACARLESSKAFAKEVMLEAGVPTAWARVCGSAAEAIEVLKGMHGPIVVKLDGLAAGKGVVVAEDCVEAISAIKSLAKMGGGRVLLEERLEGVETSLMCVCDGQKALPLMPAKDYKRALDGDLGPNTGGMGAVAPSPFVSMEEAQELTKLTILPALRYMEDKGTPYRGILYAGLMLTKNGPKVLEYNCRLGDPETQAVLPLLEDDLLGLMLESSEGCLKREALSFSRKTAVTVVMASKGYPERYDKGYEIGMLGKVVDGVDIFHAGTARDKGGALVTDGGRVLAVSAVSEGIEAATCKAYKAVGSIACQNLRYRSDIGKRAIK